MAKQIKKSKPMVTEEANSEMMASEDHVFWNTDGQIFHSLEDLARGLNIMSDEAYFYHANDGKNDFAKWVKEVLNNDRAAGLLESANDRRDAARLIAG